MCNPLIIELYAYTALWNRMVLSGCELDEVKSCIDWLQGDRAGDNIVMLEELGVKEEQTVKCNAHITLAIEVSFRVCQTEFF